MKLIFLFLLALPSWSQSFKPIKGEYYCKKGNEGSICDQILKPVVVGDKLLSVYIEYVGWCGSMGPYLYPCDGNKCWDSGIEFIFLDEKHYRWENKRYNFICEFEKK